MASITDQMTCLYCFCDDFLKAHPAQAQWRRSNHKAPRFSDAEVLTIGLMQSCLQVATLKRAYLIIAHNFRPAFPHLPCYGQWLARLHALSSLVGRLLEQALLPLAHSLYVIDSKPIPVCKPIRHGRVRLLREEGAYFGKSSSGWFFGFKLHALVHHSGAILAAILTPGNWPDQDVALALAWSVDGGIALADAGYQAADLHDLLAEEADLLVITPALAAHKRALISSLRERIETCFSQLCEHFIDRVRSRSFHGLWNSIKLKMLHHNLTVAGVIPA